MDYGLEEQIKLLGHKKTPYSFLKESDLFALLSYYEGLPNVISEALILGIPVVSTDVGGAPEQIEHGKTGWIIKNDELMKFIIILYIYLKINKL